MNSTYPIPKPDWPAWLWNLIEGRTPLPGKNLDSYEVEKAAQIVHVSVGSNEPVGYVRCLPSGAVHPAGNCPCE